MVLYKILLSTGTFSRSNTDKANWIKKFMRRGVKSLLEVQNKFVNLSSFVQDFYPIIYNSGQYSFTTVPFPNYMLPVGQELIFILVSLATYMARVSETRGDNCKQDPYPLS